jgi:hypothetical protein
MRHISFSPFADHSFGVDRRTKLEMSKNLARIYATVLEEPLPSPLQRLLEKLDLGPGIVGAPVVLAS